MTNMPFKHILAIIFRVVRADVFQRFPAKPDIDWR